MPACFLRAANILTKFTISHWTSATGYDKICINNDDTITYTWYGALRKGGAGVKRVFALLAAVMFVFLLSGCSGDWISGSDEDVIGELCSRLDLDAGAGDLELLGRTYAGEHCLVWFRVVPYDQIKAANFYMPEKNRMGFTGFEKALQKEDGVYTAVLQSGYSILVLNPDCKYIVFDTGTRVEVESVPFVYYSYYARRYAFEY